MVHLSAQQTLIKRKGLWALNWACTGRHFMLLIFNWYIVLLCNIIKLYQGFRKFYAELNLRRFLRIAADATLTHLILLHPYLFLLPRMTVSPDPATSRLILLHIAWSCYISLDPATSRLILLYLCLRSSSPCKSRSMSTSCRARFVRCTLCRKSRTVFSYKIMKKSAPK